jgi:hypothetical protein
LNFQLSIVSNVIPYCGHSFSTIAFGQQLHANAKSSFANWPNANDSPIRCSNANHPNGKQ